MTQPHAERAGSVPAEDRTKARPTISAVPIFSPGGWRERNAHLFPSDASLRWTIAKNRAELIGAGALALIGNRLIAMLPLFDQMIVAIAQRDAGAMAEARARAMDHAIEAATGDLRMPAGG
jgi:hypothetical protein